MKKISAVLATAWGIAGAISLLGFAIWRLTPMAMEIFHYQLTPLHWAALVGNIVFMAYSEGYKGFQKGYSPRVAARCLYLSKNTTWVNGLLAPLFVMGYFHATRRRLIGTYLLTTMIIGFIILIHYVHQPIRGIIDAGVVVGLGWGVSSLIYYLLVAFNREDFKYSPEVPES
jgi:hypothetical protein